MEGVGDHVVCVLCVLGTGKMDGRGRRSGAHTGAQAWVHGTLKQLSVTRRYSFRAYTYLKLPYPSPRYRFLVLRKRRAQHEKKEKSRFATRIRLRLVCKEKTGGRERAVSVDKDSTAVVCECANVCARSAAVVSWRNITGACRCSFP